jgi:hypothetical protein
MELGVLSTSGNRPPTKSTQLESIIPTYLDSVREYRGMCREKIYCKLNSTIAQQQDEKFIFRSQINEINPHDLPTRIQSRRRDPHR